MLAGTGLASFGKPAVVITDGQRHGFIVLHEAHQDATSLTMFQEDPASGPLPGSAAVIPEGSLLVMRLGFHDGR